MIISRKLLGFVQFMFAGLLGFSCMHSTHAADTPYPAVGNQDQPTFMEQMRVVPGFQAELGKVPTADLDGDGIKDFVFAARGKYSTIVQAVGYSDGSGWSVKQSLVLPTDITFQGASVVAAAKSSAGPFVVVARSQNLYVYRGWPLQLDRVIPTSDWATIGAVEIADIDNDGTLEIVSLADTHPDTLSVRSATSGALLYSRELLSQGGKGLLLDQLDADPALEMVAGENAGIVIDGATHAIDWEYTDGFGRVLLGGNFSASGRRFAAFGQRLVMFQSAPWSPLWDASAYAQTASTIDLDGDGIDEILYPGQMGFFLGVFVYNVQTRSIRDIINGIYGAGIATGEFTTSGTPNIAQVAATQPSTSANIEVLDASSGALEFSTPRLSFGSYTTALVHSNSGSGMAVVSATIEPYGSGFPGLLYSADALDDSFRWRTPNYNFADPLYSASVIQLHVVQLAGHASPVILFAAGSPYASAINALDPDNGGLLWSLPLTDDGSSFSSGSMRATLPLDRDQDGNIDAIFVCTNETRLYEYRLSDSAQVWKSDVMPNGDCHGIFQVQSSGARTVVAVLPQSMRAYDLDTRTLSWTLPFISAGASLIENGSEGSEIASFLGNTISFIDPESRTILRTLSPPLAGDIVAISKAEGVGTLDLLVTAGDRLQVIDSFSGEIINTSKPLGYLPGVRNQLPTQSIDANAYAVATGSGAGVFVHRVAVRTDSLFADGFD